MENDPGLRKPNRLLRGSFIKAAIAEALDWVRKPTPPPEVEIESVGIGASTEIPHLRLVEDPFDNNWDDVA